MAKTTVKGITIEIGGTTTQLDKALESSKKKSKALGDELSKVNKSLKFNPDNVELLTQKQTLLTERVEATSEQLRILKEAQDQVQEQFDKNEIGADQYRAFQREIIEAESKLSNFTNQLNDCTSELARLNSETSETDKYFDELTSTIAKQESELQDLTDEYTKIVLSQGKGSEEAKELASKISELNGDLQQNKDKLNDAQKEAKDLASALDDTGQSADDTKDGFTIMGGALADLTSSVIQSAISAIGDLIGSLFDLVEATEEYRQMQAKLEGSATSFGYAMEFANEKYKEFYTYVGDDQMATNAITNLMGLGLETQTLEGLVDGAISTWTAYGDSIPIESLTESIAESINVSKVTGTLADTINWASLSNEKWETVLGKGTKAQKAFNKATKDGEALEDAFSSALGATSDTKERANLISRLLNETYGESRAKYDELADSILDANEAELELKNTQADLGEAMSPVNTAITELKNKALEAILPVVEDLSDAFLDLLDYLKENPAVMDIVTGAVIALSTAFTILAGALAIETLIKGVTKAFELLGLSFSVNPVMLIIGVIGGLVAGFIYLWNTSDEFREFWIELWETITTFVSESWDTITEALSVAWEYIKELFSPVTDFFVDVFTTAYEGIVHIWESLTPVFELVWEIIKTIYSIVAPALGGFFKNAWEIIKAVWDTVSGYFGVVWASISGTFSVVGAVLGGFFSVAWESIKAVWNTVVNFFSLVWAGIQAVFAVVGAVLSGDFGRAWDAIKNVWDNAVNFFKGIWDGIKNVFGAVGTWFGNIFSSAWTAVKNVFSSWGSFFSGLWDTIKNTFSAIGTNIANAISGSVKAGINGVISSIEGTINTGINLINGAISLINKIPGVNIGKMDKLRFPRLAKGGYVLGDTIANIGEAGKEVVVPLERNLGWASIMASEIVKHMNEALSGSDLFAQLPFSDMDGLTINRRLEATFADPTTQVENIKELVDLAKDYFPKLADLAKRPIILDTGTLVGEIASPIDERLALNYDLKERGV